ncbi:LOW QUALITY PROTEIN: thrombospondin type-1 domain-containing protein 4-like [Amphiura filiformis]|uniref:LOW QUALITY PROTEIN: thrombospondin type-1 domain-containing protein 4-like n=1 Tax=Amphiura filiformis TaxID=82378 RepID=UPI003B21AE93
MGPFACNESASCRTSAASGMCPFACNMLTMKTIKTVLFGLLCIICLTHIAYTRRHYRHKRDGTTHLISYWSGWGPWSECSRTCGGGVAMQNRDCLRRRHGEKMMAGNRQCVGLYKQYKLCNTEPCEDGGDNFRGKQCREHDDQKFMGKMYEWEPYDSISNPCELHCRAIGYRFFAKLADKVIDGTPCRQDSTDEICVNGMCKVVGCDGVLGSGLVKDKCGVCGGDNTACDVFSGDYTEANMAIGYHKAFRIPQGAMYINVTEMAKSRNYLALQDSSGETKINGNWRIDLPGNFTVGGTVIQYKRDARAKVGEQFLATGPTKEDLFVVLIYQTSNPGIHYEYVMLQPGRQQNAPKPDVQEDTSASGAKNSNPRQPTVARQPTFSPRDRSPVNVDTGRGSQLPERQGFSVSNQQQQRYETSRPNGNTDNNGRNHDGSSQRNPPRTSTAYYYNKQRTPSSSTSSSGRLGPTSALSQTQTGTVYAGDRADTNQQNQREQSPDVAEDNPSRDSGRPVDNNPASNPRVDQTNTRQGGTTFNRNPQRQTLIKGPQLEEPSNPQPRGNIQRESTDSRARNKLFQWNPGQGTPIRTGTRGPTGTGGSGGSGTRGPTGTGGSGGSDVGVSSGGRGRSNVPSGGIYRPSPYGSQSQRYPGATGGGTYTGRQNPVTGGQSPYPTGGGVNPIPNNRQQGSYYSRQQAPYGSNPGQTPGRGGYSQLYRPQYQPGSGGNPPVGQSGSPYPGYQSTNPQQGGVPNTQYSREQYTPAGTSVIPGVSNPETGAGGLPTVLNPYTSIGAKLKEHMRGVANTNPHQYQPLTGPSVPGVATIPGAPQPGVPQPGVPQPGVPQPGVPGGAGYDNVDPSQQQLPNVPLPGAGPGRGINEGQGNRLFNRPQYMWFETGRTDCSVTCGGGLQQSIVECVQENSYTAVEQNLCDANFKPNPRPRTCNQEPCPPVWDAGEWGECSRSCGQGRQIRSVVCKQTYTQSLTTTVASDRCDPSTKPNNVQDCKLESCAAWRSGEWGECSAQCGEGTKERQVKCVDERNEELADEACEGLSKPSTTLSCDNGGCVAKWFASDWSQLCSSECGGGDRARDVVCATEGYGSVLDDEQCHSDQKPRDNKMCNNMPCGAKWFASMWGQCSAECGEGTQSRAVVCVSSTEPFTILPSENCPMGDKPPLTQTCILKECQAKWFKSDWSECSKTCDGGHRTRDAKCLDENLQPSNACSTEERPEERQSCNIQQCSLAPPPDDDCRDKFSYCTVVAQARLCSYSYYRTSCCFSCFGRQR